MALCTPGVDVYVVAVYDDATPVLLASSANRCQVCSAAAAVSALAAVAAVLCKSECGQKAVLLKMVEAVAMEVQGALRGPSMDEQVLGGNRNGGD